MKKTPSPKATAPTTHRTFKWQTGDYDSRARFTLLFPTQFLLLCRLTNTTPEQIIEDFIDNVCGGSWKREGREGVKAHLLQYFIAHGYGQPCYSANEIQQMFKELDALGALFPANGTLKQINLYAHWRNKHHRYFFKKWLRELVHR